MEAGAEAPRITTTTPAEGGRVHAANALAPVQAAGAAMESIAGSLFSLADEGIVIADFRGRVRAVNPAFTTITGYGLEELQGLPIRHLRSSRHDSAFYGRALRRALKEGSWRGETWARRRQGQTFPAWLTLSAVRDAGGEVSHYILILSDMARLSERMSHLEHMAYHDALTGLPNRMLLMSRLEAALARSRRARHVGAVLFLDLDFFKTINDVHGHAAGDEVLREVGRRLTHRLRASDMAARFGGDEFVMLLEELKSVEDAGEVAHDVIALLQHPITLQDGQIAERIGASVGIAIFQGDAIGPDELVRRADDALFDAKRTGRSSVSYFNRESAGRRQGKA